MFNSNPKVSADQVLFPLCLVAFTLFVMLAFQTTQIVRERDALNQAMTQQTSAVEQSQKVEAQVNALATGTAQLAQKGDKNAEAVVTRMKQLGVTLGGPQAEQVAPAAGSTTGVKPASASVPVAAPAQ